MLTVFEIIIIILSVIIVLIFFATVFTIIFAGKITEDTNTTTKKKPKKIKQFLFVEDGSIDENLIEDLNESNPEIKVIVYRQGSRMPVIENLKRREYERK